MSDTNHTPRADDARVASLRESADRTRAQMSVTIQALEEKLNPQEWRDKAATELETVEAHIKTAVREELLEVKAILKEEIKDVKVAVNEVIENARVAVKEDAIALKDSVRDDLIAAKDAVKEDVKQTIADARASARAATLGRLEDFATQAGDVMNTSKDTLVDTVRQNPIPAALMGIGLAWLLMNRSSSAAQRRSGGFRSESGSRSYGRSFERAYGDDDQDIDYGQDTDNRSARGRARSDFDSIPRAVSGAVDSAGQAISDVQHRVTDAVHGMRDQASSLAHRTAESASNIAHDAAQTTSHLWHDATDAGERAYKRVSSAVSDVAREAPVQARRAERAAVDAYMDNPIAIGAAVLAAGALVGMALPRTEREDALFGGARDQLLVNAKEVAHDAIASVQHMGEDAAENVKGVLAQASHA